MGRLFLVDLEGRFYSCKSCRTHLALYSDVVSRSFHSGRSGKAYLFNKVVNVFSGEKEERNMMTGKYTAADIFCVKCATMLGWEYETAHEESQKYKEGKSVLVRVKISGYPGANAAAGNVADNA